MEIAQIVLTDTMPTRGIDQLVADDATRDRIVDFARTKETDYERLKLVHDNLLSNTTYAPLLSAAPDISEDDLKKMILEAGWVVDFDEKFGTPEELAMWLNRFRRFRAAVIAAK